MDLSTWAIHHYRISALKGFLIYLGANTYRCEACRHNFISLRRRKYKYNHRGSKSSKAPEGTESQAEELTPSDQD